KGVCCLGEKHSQSPVSQRTAASPRKLLATALMWTFVPVAGCQRGFPGTCCGARSALLSTQGVSIMNRLFHHCFAKLRHAETRSPTPNRRCRTYLYLEALEDRCVPTVFNVNTLADLSISPGVNTSTGQINGTKFVTLRSAIEAANATPGNNT